MLRQFLLVGATVRCAAAAADEFTKTWTSKPLRFKLLPDTEFIENICDNEKDVERIKAAR